MERRIVRAGIGVLAAAVLAACATGEEKKMMSADEAIAARQQLMKDNGATVKRIQDNLKAGQVQAVAADAEKLVQNSKQIPSLFPAGSLNPDKSRAKPEIWQKWPEFEGNAKSLGAKATQLAATSRTGDAAATNAAVADLGRTTCGACHTAFRGPELKK
jgi:cytochrome c556